MAKTENGPVLFDIDKCKGCELCVFYCPRKCLSISAGFNSAGNKFAVLSAPEGCNSCGICYLMCPDYAVKIMAQSEKHSGG